MKIIWVYKRGKFRSTCREIYWNIFRTPYIANSERARKHTENNEAHGHKHAGSHALTHSLTHARTHARMHARTHGAYEDDVSADYASSLRWRARGGDSCCMYNATFTECGNVPSVRACVCVCVCLCACDASYTGTRATEGRGLQVRTYCAHTKCDQIYTYIYIHIYIYIYIYKNRVPYYEIGA